MPRKERECLPDRTYHVFSRCIEKRDLMRDDFMRDLMEQVLAMTKNKYKFKLNHWSILPDHFHFLIQTVKNGATISRIMQYIKARYAEKYNKLMGRTGPFWNERFGDRIVEHAKNPALYLLTLLIYLAYNAVRKKLVSNPRKYKYCSINAYLDRNYKSKVKITLHPYFLRLGNTFEECVKRLLEFEEGYRKRLSCIFENLAMV